MSKDQDVFIARYEVDDGYAGGSRPQSFKVRAGDFCVTPNMTDDQITDAFYEMVDEDMKQRVSACHVNASAFLAWARSLKPTE